MTIEFVLQDLWGSIKTTERSGTNVPRVGDRVASSADRYDLGQYVVTSVVWSTLTEFVTVYASDPRA